MLKGPGAVAGELGACVDDLRSDLPGGLQGQPGGAQLSHRDRDVLGRVRHSSAMVCRSGPKRTVPWPGLVITTACVALFMVSFSRTWLP